MRRREFISLLGGAAAAWPLAVRAQQLAMPVIGYLSGSWADLFPGRVRAFREGLDETGYSEARNVTIEYRWAEGKNDHIPALAADLVHLDVSIMVAAESTPAALAAKAATATIPIVFIVGTDPVEAGLVVSLSRPGGNLTGVTSFNQELGPKRLELLHQVVPPATTIALLANPTSLIIAEADSRRLQTAARTLGRQLHILHASNEHEVESVFAKLVQLQIGALVVGADTFFTNRSEKLAALAIRHAIPTIYQTREFAMAGGLMSYGGELRELYRLAGVYTGRILKGEKPTNLPVHQVTKVELIVNLKTARGLGLTIPLPLLGRADEVIE
jgi:putative tryptophan/tyrosine transport system substrate-binding protein